MSIEAAPLLGGFFGFGVIVSLAFTVLCTAADSEERRGSSILCNVLRACAGALVTCYVVASIVATSVWLNGVFE